MDCYPVCRPTPQCQPAVSLVCRLVQSFGIGSHTIWYIYFLLRLPIYARRGIHKMYINCTYPFIYDHDFSLLLWLLMFVAEKKWNTQFSAIVSASMRLAMENNRNSFSYFLSFIFRCASMFFCSCLKWKHAWNQFNFQFRQLLGLARSHIRLWDSVTQKVVIARKIKNKQQ